ncbi:winged helix-turn-helix domain-containing protein [Acetobacter estunensis]|uniref:winged helix-turn-helix domain-containing protein n=1 Tax=Acetobacter estunensis TaxID=104097 RepID=UPI001C2CDE98|nr:winged helix-turn-helix domain-containing protein [Acetobacter estunensis]MBV1837971.1 winged helix-turn-helix domain-containing protein [Acetobacter estunensis]
MSAEIRLTLRMDVDGHPALGHGKIRLLEQLAESGSISAAGRAMGMSYRRAWLLIDALNSQFRTPVVETRPGGGGGARLTEMGKTVIRCYRQAEYDARAGARAPLDELATLLRPENDAAS